MTKLRVRQHVNPLCQKYQTFADLPDWKTIYSHPYHTLHLDIGCARGKFVLQMAQQNPHINYLGVEIREPLVIEANEIRDQEKLTNLHYLYTNINITLAQLLQSFPENTLKVVTIQFPDPWFKHRHAKRRVIQPEFVATLAQYLTPETIIFLQSDVKILAEEMIKHFTKNPAFVRQHETLWLADNPFLIKTEREIVTEEKGEPVYRALFQKSAVNHF